MNVANLLERSARTWPRRPALAHGTAVVASYEAFADSAAARGEWLAREHGVAAGERVALFLANTPAYLELLYAIWWMGAVAVPINAKLHAREVGWILGDSGARVCLVDAQRAEDLAGHAPAQCTVLAAGAADPPPARIAGGARPAPAARAGDDVAWLFYTSGTTGRPKGVMLTHASLVLMTLGYLADVLPVAPGDACLHPAPLSHGSGLYNFAYVARAGINVVPRSGGFEPDEIFELVAAWPRCAFFAAPTMVKRLVEHAHRTPPDPDTLRNLAAIVYGGGPMYLADIEAAIATLGMRFVQIYGQGESPMTITVLPREVIADVAHPRYRERLASVGHAHSMVEVSIRAPGEGTALTEALPAGEIGEVCVRGDVVMRGYWNNPSATAAALREGWLYTGDVGVLDEDGFLTLKDRSKDLIISGGTNVYPREVEEALLEHPLVAEVAVVGMPDAEWGESVLAFVVPRAGGQAPPARVQAAIAGETAASSALAGLLDAHCLERIARFKRPRQYRFVAELPKNNYGKVLKTTLRQHVR